MLAASRWATPPVVQTVQGGGAGRRRPYGIEGSTIAVLAALAVAVTGLVQTIRHPRPGPPVWQGDGPGRRD
jgi:hypothetical protein